MGNKITCINIAAPPSTINTNTPVGVGDHCSGSVSGVANGCSSSNNSILPSSHMNHMLMNDHMVHTATTNTSIQSSLNPSSTTTVGTPATATNNMSDQSIHTQIHTAATHHTSMGNTLNHYNSKAGQGQGQEGRERHTHTYDDTHTHSTSSNMVLPVIQSNTMTMNSTATTINLNTSCTITPITPSKPIHQHHASSQHSSHHSHSTSQQSHHPSNNPQHHLSLHLSSNEIDITHYDILRVIGKGGFGRVFAGIDKSTQQIVAIKQISKQMILKSSNRVKMIHNERHVMINNKNPFIIHALCCFQSDSDLFIVSPFVAGGDMRYHICERSLLNEQQLKYYAAELLLAIESLHQRNVIYRDCKPENILLQSDGHIGITDFGLSVTVDAATGSVTTGKIGTSGYQPPEMLAGAQYGTEVDVFGYGVTLYELFHGRRPWSSDTISQYMEQQQHQPEGYYTYLPEFYISSRCSSELRALLLALLDSDRATRIGCGSNGLQDIKCHIFFTGIDWHAVSMKQTTPPIIPNIHTLNFDTQLDAAEQEVIQQELANQTAIKPEHQQCFSQWNYNTMIQSIPVQAIEMIDENSDQMSIQESTSTDTNLIATSHPTLRPHTLTHRNSYAEGSKHYDSNMLHNRNTSFHLSPRRRRNTNDQTNINKNLVATQSMIPNAVSPTDIILSQSSILSPPLSAQSAYASTSTNGNPHHLASYNSAVYHNNVSRASFSNSAQPSTIIHHARGNSNWSHVRSPSMMSPSISRASYSIHSPAHGNTRPSFNNPPNVNGFFANSPVQERRAGLHSRNKTITETPKTSHHLTSPTHEASERRKTLNLQASGFLTNSPISPKFDIPQIRERRNTAGSQNHHANHTPNDKEKVVDPPSVHASPASINTSNPRRSTVATSLGTIHQ